MVGAAPSRTAIRVTFVAIAVLVFAATGPQPARAADEEQTGTAAEAWYSSSPIRENDPVCAPADCPVRPGAPARPYPERTLHVEAVSGRETARTYVRFDHAVLPLGARLTGGTATLPVADEASGSFDPESATMAACLVTERFEEAEGGSPDAAAPVDCETSAPAEFDPEAGEFTVDLAVFATAWETGEPEHGIALMADPSAQSGTWHVAFSASDREEEGAAAPITATLRYEGGTGLGTDTASLFPLPGSGTPAASSGVATTPTSGTAEPPVPAPQVASPNVAPPAAAPAAPPVAAAALRVDPYEPVWFLPLLLLALAGALARSLTREVEVLPADALPPLPVRLWQAFFPPDDWRSDPG